jgi:hypothetical protein
MINYSTYAEAIQSGFIGVKDYKSKADLGLSNDTIKKLIAKFGIECRTFSSNGMVYRRADIDKAVMRLQSNLVHSHNKFYTSSIITGHFMCDTKALNIYIRKIFSA